MKNLSDQEFESIKSRLNSAIHELVFAVAQAEQDDLYDATTCLTTAQNTINQVADELEAKIHALSEAQPKTNP